MTCHPVIAVAHSNPVISAPAAVQLLVERKPQSDVILAMRLRHERGGGLTAQRKLLVDQRVFLGVLSNVEGRLQVLHAVAADL